MRFEKSYSVIVIIAFLLMLSSCAKGGSDLKIEISQPDKNLIDLASKVYEERQLLELIKFNGSINEFSEKYPI